MKSLRRKVQVWIFSKDEKGRRSCLLLKTNEKRGSFWQPVTGSVEKGEEYLEAARREALEETGFKFKGAPLDANHEFEFTTMRGEAARERVFALSIEGQPAPKLDPHEHQDYKWVAVEEAARLVRFPSNAEGLKKTLRLLS
jgi:8-oxo-dGTP pyrophosphatase MutT (NUDIX family)